MKTDRYFDIDYYAIVVHVIGLGGVGSYSGEVLVRSGFGAQKTPLHFWDHDTYEDKNLNNQSIFKHHLGKNKASSQRLKLISIYPQQKHIVDHPEKVKKQKTLSGVVILAVDSMESRRNIVDNCIIGNHRVECVIDVRMDNELCTVYTFNPRIDNHVECWKMYTPDDGFTEHVGEIEYASPGPDAVVMSAGLAVRQLKLYCRNHNSTVNNDFRNRVYVDFERGVFLSEHWPKRRPN